MRAQLEQLGRGGHQPRLLLQLAPGGGGGALAWFGKPLWDIPTRRPRGVPQQQAAAIGHDHTARGWLARHAVLLRSAATEI